MPVLLFWEFISRIFTRPRPSHAHVRPRLPAALLLEVWNRDAHALGRFALAAKRRDDPRRPDRVTLIERAPKKEPDDPHRDLGISKAHFAGNSVAVSPIGNCFDRSHGLKAGERKCLRGNAQAFSSNFTRPREGGLRGWVMGIPLFFYPDHDHDHDPDTDRDHDHDPDRDRDES